MKHHIQKAQSSLGELAALSSKTDAAERNILKSAEARLEEVQKSLSRMKTGVESSPEKEQDRYIELIEERGQLNIVIAKARKALGIK